MCLSAESLLMFRWLYPSLTECSPLGVAADTIIIIIIINVIIFINMLDLLIVVRWYLSVAVASVLPEIIHWNRVTVRHSFTLGQGAIPPNLSLAPKSLVTATVCSSKTSKQLYGGLCFLDGWSGWFGSFGMCFEGNDCIKKVVNFFVLPPPKKMFSSWTAPGHCRLTSVICVVWYKPRA